MEHLPYVITVRFGRSKARVSILSFAPFRSPSPWDTVIIGIYIYIYTRVHIASYTVLYGFCRARVRHIVIQSSTIITGRQQMHASNFAKAFFERSCTCHYESLVCLFLYFFFIFFFLHSWMNSRTRFFLRTFDFFKILLTWIQDYKWKYMYVPAGCLQFFMKIKLFRVFLDKLWNDLL